MRVTGLVAVNLVDNVEGVVVVLWVVYWLRWYVCVCICVRERERAIDSY